MTPTHDTDIFPIPPLSTEHQARMKELIDRFELARDSGSPVSMDDLCTNEPHLLKPLRDAVYRLKSVDVMFAAAPTLPMPNRIGEFLVVEPIGTGATGMVFRCRQKNPDRDVAVKVLKPLLDADVQHRRFQREIAALSAIQQDGMAAVYQSGVTDWSGVRCFWIAMELLDGGDVCQYLKKNPGSETNVLKAFRTICETLRAAHRLGILHRDIKPNNILMSKDGAPHLVDFGLAKLPGSFVGVHQTEQGVTAIRGTAAWMAPELLLSEKSVADVRSEIFSLGVVLFEMLTGQHPYAADRLTTPQIAARIAQRITVPISTALPTASADLKAFVSRLMAFDPDERYQNLDDVLADTDRLLSGEPVHVRFVPWPERTIKFLRAHWLICSTATLVLAAIFAVVTVVVASSNQLRQQDQILSKANDLLLRKKMDLLDQTLQLEHALKLRERTISNNRLRSMQSTVLSMPMETLRSLEDLQQFPVESRGFAWQLLYHEATIDVQDLPNAGGSVCHLTFDSASRRLIVTSTVNRMSICDLLTRAVVVSEVSVLSHANPKLRHGTDFFLTVSEDRLLSEFSTVTGQLVRSFPETAEMSLRFAVSADGRLASGRIAGDDMIVLNLESGEVCRRQGLLRKNLAGVWFSQNGETVSFVDQSGLWLTCRSSDLSEVDRRELAEFLPTGARPRLAEFSASMGRESCLAMSYSGEGIVVAHFDTNVATGTNQFMLRGEVVRQLHFIAPRSLLSVGNNIQIHDVDGDQPTRVLPIARQIATTVAVANDGRTIASGTNRGDISVFKLDASLVKGESIPVFQDMPALGFGNPKSMLPIRDSDLVFVGFTAGWIAVVDQKRHRTLEVFPLAPGPINSIHHDLSRGLVAIGSGGVKPTVTVLKRTESGSFCEASAELIREAPAAVATLYPTGDVRVVRFTDDGSHLLVALRNGDLMNIDCNSWEFQEFQVVHVGGIYAMAVKDDLCITGGTDGDIVLRQISTGNVLNRWHAHDNRITHLDLSPDRSKIYVASHDGEISVWSIAGDKLLSLVGHGGPVTGLTLSDDGNTLVSGCKDGRILIWDAITGDIQRDFEGHRDHVTDLHFIANNSRLLSSGLDGELKCWKGSFPPDR